MKVLTHNVYWFQGHPSRWGNERVAEVPEVLAALTHLYASVHVDILCLQEVHAKTLAETLARELGMASWIHVPGGLRPDYGGVILCRQKARFRDCTRMNGTPLHERVHLRASLTWHTGPLELAAIHLPSNRFAGSAEAGDTARLMELKRILSEPPRPHLVVGDLNCRPDSLPYRFLLDSGYTDAARVQNEDAAHKRRVDYIWLDERCANHLTDFAIFDSGPFCRTPPQGDPWRLSDHPPLFMALQ